MNDAKTRLNSLIENGKSVSVTGAVAMEKDIAAFLQLVREYE